VLLDYPTAVAWCSSSSLMPTPYGMRGGYRATFADAVLEYTMRAGFTGQGPSTLTEYTDAGERSVPLSQDSPYAQMIDHVLACCVATPITASPRPARCPRCSSRSTSTTG
jgi:hypothetical protein